MGNKPRKRQVKKALRNADDILNIFTGRRWRFVLGKAVNVFGDDMMKRFTKFIDGPEESELPPESPYSILGVRVDAMDFVVKASYKELMKNYHPDGTQPDEEKAKAINGAYEAICKERGIPR